MRIKKKREIYHIHICSICKNLENQSDRYPDQSKKIKRAYTSYMLLHVESEIIQCIYI